MPDEIALHMKNLSEKQSSGSAAKKSPGKQVSKPDLFIYAKREAFVILNVQITSALFSSANSATVHQTG